MRLSLKSTPKWLFIPPAVALLLLLGPLSMSGTAATPATGDTATAVKTPTEDAGRANRPSPTLPRTPDMWQMTSALIGVLLLGVAAILVMRKLRGGAVPARGSAPLATLRQTLRLSSRQAIHAIEFDDRILLIGEHERGLVLLESGKPNGATDEAEVLARHSHPEVATEADDEGAVPKNLVIPRPPQRAPRQATQQVARDAPPAARTPNPRQGTGLNDFRQLLQKVGRA